MKLSDKIKGLMHKSKAVPTQDLSVAQFEPATIPVADLKQYLVNCYEENRNLQDKIATLEQKLEEGKGLKAEYEVALVTLQEYSDQLRKAKDDAELQKQKIERLNNEILSLKESNADYKIKEFNAHYIKEEEVKAIVKELKDAIIDNINNHKGNLSHSSAVILVKNTVIDRGVCGYIE
jgi:cell division septum initiation protein DivIVA